MTPPELTIVVAVDKQNGIGINNQLPWHLPEDLAHFKRVTSGHPILMGRKTFESIGRPLPNRRNIVITRNAAWQHEGVERAASVGQAVALCGSERGFIIGGAQVFIEALPLVHSLIVTEIDARFNCDTFFPAIDPAQWVEQSREHQHSEKTGLDFDIVTYRRN
ncbi:dihydrofolate reductase [Lacisediminimonas sp.]|uniref:dihydrofolate reductase n=1 Tax=Lacisediminimonas sp. TaxID=3060582 RepID=UPI0027259BE6|nr:dihydrofolate reductase [Lacisediminimonas sp.]MDO8299059.1 dihydrofolate reductase [Lacisediminimonas sp.]